jgi:succinyl-CoA synthetase beta subunit
VLGFHGSGGGGSMMSMDALAALGFRCADFCDTSGNPPASKVYRAARIILSQPGIDGYFLSGSGVASQEQHNGARGLIKAFREAPLSVPAVIRLGGNKEELAIEYLARFCADLPVKVEGYGKDDPVAFCAERMRALIAERREKCGGEDAGGEARREFEAALAAVRPLHNPDSPKSPYSFKTLTGSITFDHSKCASCDSKVCISACSPGILSLDGGGLPRLNISEADAARGKCTECLACEAECWFGGRNAIRIELPIAGL